MVSLKYLATLFALSVLAACGGGGGNAGTPKSGSSLGGSNVSTAPIIELVLNNAANATTSKISALDIFTLRATLRDASGSVLAGQVVKFSGDATLFKFSAANATGLTDANGVASIQISPATATSSGAGMVTADSSVAGKSATQAALGVEVVALASGGAASVALEMRSPTNVVTSTISALDTNTLRATVRDATGNLLPAQAVTFSSASGLAKFSPAASALTDASGVATVSTLRRSSTAVGTDFISAAVTVAGVALTPASINAYVSPLVNGGLPTIALGLRDQINASTATLSRSTTTFAQVQLLDATGVAPLPTVVTVTGDPALVNFPSGATGLSDSTGVARIPVAVVPTSVGGAGTLTAAATVSGSPVSASFDYQVPVGGSVGVPTITLGLVGGGNSITASGLTGARATVKDANGVAILGKMVTFSGDAALIKFSPVSGQVLTDSGGLAVIQVSPTSLSAAGASTLAAKTTVGTTTMSASFDFQLADANLGLQGLNLGIGSLAAYGNRAISVLATINGLAAINIPVQVTFSASCGTIKPSVVTTDAAGTANSTYTANLAECAGTNVTVTAAAVGAATVSGTVAVAAPIATNVQFVSTAPQLIYLSESVGTSQAQVIFKVVDSSGNPLQNKKLRLSLSNTATGVSIDTVGNPNSVDLTTDNQGLVSVAVFSGTVPTSLNVKATLLDSNGVETKIFSNSNLLTVASGRPTQRSLSLGLEKMSIEGMNHDGVKTNITLSMADRQGNPVPPGTQVNFVSETGVVLPAVCFVPPAIPATATSPAIPVSSCTVTLASSGSRTASGKVSILAYVSGEEDFIDVNGNNVYDSGDIFNLSTDDLGRAFRDDNGATGVNSRYDLGEFQVPRVGVSACTAAAGCVGDGVWGAADVRAQATVIFASSDAVIIPPVSAPGLGMTSSALTFTVKDRLGNSMPTGTTIAVSGVVGPTSGNIGACTVISNANAVVQNSLYPTTLTAVYTCLKNDLITVAVTSPLGTTTSQTYLVP